VTRRLDYRLIPLLIAAILVLVGAMAWGSDTTSDGDSTPRVEIDYAALLKAGWTPPKPGTTRIPVVDYMPNSRVLPIYVDSTDVPDSIWVQMPEQVARIRVMQRLAVIDSLKTEIIEGQSALLRLLEMQP
jgi:hypothetical protein